MKKTIYICDHCGKEEEEMEYSETVIDDFSFYRNVDLCTDCYNELDNIVKEFCGYKGE